MHILVLLKFTPLEFETKDFVKDIFARKKLKFTPLEFETGWLITLFRQSFVKIYSVGV